MTVVYLEDIDRIQYRFTELGKAIADMSRENKGYIEETTQTLTDGFQNMLSEIGGSEALQQLGQQTQVLEASVADMSKLFNSVLQTAQSSFGELAGTAAASRDGLQDIVDKLKEVANKEQGGGDPAKKGPAGFVGWIQGFKQDRAKQKKKGKLPGPLQKEISTFKSKLSGMAGKAKLPKLGTVAAGGLMWMAFGFQEKDRMQAEAGEIKNVLESAFDAGIRGVLNKATRASAQIQETLQRYYGVARQEFQGVQKAFVQGGIGAEQMGAKVGKAFAKDIPNTFVTNSLALDKMFEMSGGTSAQRAVSMMHNYGMSLEDASDTVKDMYLNEQAMAIGAPTFVKNVETAAESLKGLGFSIRGVMDIASKLQESFEAIGVPKQFAGKLAGAGVKEMAQGVASLSDDWKVFLAERMKWGTGLAGLQRFEENFSRVREGNSVAEYKNLVVEMYRVAQEQGGGDEAREYMMLSRDMQMGSAGARAAMTVGKLADKGDLEGATKATAKHMKTFNKSFQTEKAKASAFKRHMNKWMKGISEVGQGLLGLVGRALAYLIAYTRAVPQMFANMVAGKWEENAKLQKQIVGFAMGGRDDVALMKKGFSKMGDAGKDMFGDVFSSSMGALSNAWSADFSGGDGSSDGVKSTGRPMSMSVPPRAITRTVVVPSGSEAGSEFAADLLPEVEQAARAYTGPQGGWVGGGIIFKSQGVNEAGDILLNLGGNCPRCGLVYGTTKESAAQMTSQQVGDVSSDDEEALARMIQTEAGGSDVYGKGRSGVASGREDEALMIGQTAINRLLDPKKRYGKSLHEVIVGNRAKEYGKQGKEGRPYGTRRAASADARRLAKRLLGGQSGVGDAGGATYFYHSRPGAEMVRKGKSLALPPFARRRVNVANVPLRGKGRYARFYSDKGLATSGEAANRQDIDTFLEEKHAKKIAKRDVKSEDAQDSANAGGGAGK